MNVYSPARIPNIKGDPTEVDVAFSTIEDPSEHFEFIQVRDRSGNQDKTWVEQIIGQKISLGIESATIVSTSDFAEQAIRLAVSQNIRLRLLLPESDENIKPWFKSDILGLNHPLFEIDVCSFNVKKGSKYYILKADRQNSTDQYFLIPTEVKGKYKAMSLNRVFDHEFRRHPDRRQEIIETLPKDDQFHTCIFGIEYEEPSLYVLFNGQLQDGTEVDNEILPIYALAFAVRANNQFKNYPITHRYKYINPADNELLAQAIMSEIILDGRHYYFCLLRHSYL